MTCESWSDELSSRNRATRDLWRQYAPHRMHVMQFAAALGRSGHDRICLLGVGNANDVDLNYLVQIYREVHLVDGDAEAMATGVARQIKHGSPRIVCHPACDLSGCLDLKETSAESIEAAVELGPTAVLQEPVDVVVSLGLLSQLIESAAARWQEYAQRDQLLLQLRTAHLRYLTRCVQPGGRLLVIFDFVSSATAPELLRAADSEVPSLAARLIRQNNFFTGLNPLAVKQQLLELDLDGHHLSDVWLSPPWRWQVTDKAHAVCALTARCPPAWP
jgi:hypothetical protein